jgi:hypothetical protein
MTTRRVEKSFANGENLSALVDLSGQWIDLVHGRRPPHGIVLDMDSSVSPTHGEQEISVWNTEMSKAGGSDSKNTLYCSFCGKSPHNASSWCKGTVK